MTLWRAARALGVGLLATAALSLAGCADREPAAADAPEIAFSILSAQGQASAAPLWQPLLDDLGAAVGAKVRPHFASSYSALVEDMKAGRTQAGWFSAGPAVEAIDEAGAEMIARTIGLDGGDRYHALLIVRRGSGLDLERVLKCPNGLSFGAADPGSTSGALALSTFLFNPRRVDPEGCFQAVRTGNHEQNAAQVASGVLAVAASNTATLEALRLRSPTLADQIEVIWRSPPLPEGGILLRGDLDPALKEKIRSFFLTYGQGAGADAEQQRRVLAGLRYSRFSAADDDYLDPVREMIADQTLAAARRRGDAAAAAQAEGELQRLRARREVLP